MPLPTKRSYSPHQQAIRLKDPLHVPVNARLDPLIDCPQQPRHAASDVLFHDSASQVRTTERYGQFHVNHSEQNRF